MHRRCERAALRPPSRARNHPGAIFGAGGGGAPLQPKLNTPRSGGMRMGRGGEITVSRILNQSVLF
jgi:hypothetical protein